MSVMSMVNRVVFHNRIVTSIERMKGYAFAKFYQNGLRREITK